MNYPMSFNEFLFYLCQRVLWLLLTTLHRGSCASFPREAGHKVFKSNSFEIGLIEFENLCSSVLGASYLTSISPSFLLCKMGMMIRFALYSCCVKRDNNTHREGPGPVMIIVIHKKAK